MKKRCTNSSCRKVFRVDSHECPYCGKQYPRVNPGADKYAVVLTYIGAASSVRIIMAAKPYTGRPDLNKWRMLNRNIPSLVVTNLTHQQAKACRVAIRAAGGDAMVIPVSRGTKGIFVYGE